jgi:NADPH-dependent curcumin reductase CurA
LASGTKEENPLHRALGIAPAGPQAIKHCTRVTLASRPAVGKPVVAGNFAISEKPGSAPWPLRERSASDILARTLYVSVDPYMRCRFNEDPGVDYTQPFGEGELIYSAGIGEVIDVRPGAETSLKVGDIVLDWFDGWGWSSVAEFNAEQAAKLKVLPVELAAMIPLTYTMGGTGQTGLSAYFGILGEVDPSEKDIVIISGAAGAVGTVAGQLAKRRGARVIGICGSDSKCRVLVDELGFDCAVNYKLGRTEELLAEALTSLAGRGGRPEVEEARSESESESESESKQHLEQHLEQHRARLEANRAAQVPSCYFYYRSYS